MKFRLFVRRAWLPLVMVSACAASTSAGEKISLFNGRDLAGWSTFIDPKAPEQDPAKIWSVKEGVIHCVGKPAGYLLTDKEYDNFVLRFQWRWPSKPGNSGAFVHVVGENKIWPKGVEAQLAANNAGDIWLVDGAKLTVDLARQDKGTPRHFYRLKTDKAVEKPLGEWNQYEITCDGDEIKLVVNGQLVNVGTQSELTRGKILLQSEGAEIEFRNIELEPLP